MREHWVFLVLAGLFVFLLLFFPLGGQYLYRFFRWSSPPLSDLTLENQALKARLAELIEIAGFTAAPAKAQPAAVLVRYPFNFRNSILAAVDNSTGIALGSAAVILPDPASRAAILVGRVSEVFPQAVRIQTVFDNEFQIGVRVGEAGIAALLQGGSKPRLTLIPKTAALTEKDIIFTAAEGLPPGLAVGEIKTVVLAEGGLLQEADLELAYDIGRLRTVFILSP